MNNVHSALDILIVEDDEDDYFILNDLLLEALGQLGHVQWASNYELALEFIATEHYHFYFIDNRLGAHLGLDLLEKIKEQYETSPPIIMLSGVDDHKTDLLAMDKGADDYIIKSQLSAPLLERTIRYSLKSKQLEERLAKMAHFDSLTGLYNRSIFNELLLKTIEQSRRLQQKFALVTIDLDDFKYINDHYGHPAGDQLLMKVSRRLKNSIRSSDVIARIGGDEFSLILKYIGRNSDFVNIVDTIMGAFTASFQVENKEIQSTISAGIAIYPTDADNGTKLINRSDRAMYQAKSKGGNTYSFYNQELHSKARKRHQIESQLKQAICDNKLVLYYQPIYSLLTNQLVSYEALLRWPNESGGFYNTEEVIGIAEQSQLILALGDWVFNRAFDQLLAWQKQGDTEVKVSINVSAKQFKNDDFTEIVIEKLSYNPKMANKINFELTERDPLEGSQAVITRLQKLASFGCEFSVDDFGIGHSSISYLRTFPISVIKIDKSIVQNIFSNKEDYALCKAVIAIGEALGLNVVAEGVETLEVADTLRSIHCPLVQGYYFSIPKPIGEIN